MRIFGDEIHPYFKRVIDSLPEGRLLLSASAVKNHAAYAAEVGWQVQIIGFTPADAEEVKATKEEEDVNLTYVAYEPGKSLAEPESYDAIMLLFEQLPQDIRSQLHQEAITALKADGGNLYILAFSHEQPPENERFAKYGYTKEELLRDFKPLQIDLIQDQKEELPGVKDKVNVIHFSGLRHQSDRSDSVSF